MKREGNPDSSRSRWTRVLHRPLIFSRTIDLCVRPTAYVQPAIPGSRVTHVGMYRAVSKLQSPSDGCGWFGYWREAIRLRRIGGEPAIFETEKRRHDWLIREHLIYSFTERAGPTRWSIVWARWWGVSRMRDPFTARNPLRSRYPWISVGPSGSTVGVWLKFACTGIISSHMTIIFLQFKMYVQSAVDKKL